MYVVIIHSSVFVNQDESVGSATGLPTIQGEIAEEDEDLEKVDDVFEPEKAKQKERKEPEEEGNLTGMSYHQNLHSIFEFK